jgi:3-hydroxy-9,10-secoandrosta-1,3,5(10)-triene-9,17-dione monooxygenase
MVQDEVFGRDHFQAPHSARGEYGTIRAADGGWIVNGTWPYCSGVPYATHFMGNARILNADGSPVPGSPPRVAVVIVPPGGFTMLDDWGDTLGMRGTGSNGVRVENVFVPQDYAVVWGQGSDKAAPTPGIELHGNPLYLGRWKPHYSCESQSVLIGATKGALEVYEEVLRNRSLSRPGMFSDTKRYLDIGHQRNFGVALVKLASAEALMKQSTRMHAEYCERWKRDGIPYSDFDEELVMHLIRQAGSIATESMDVIFASAGTRAAKDGDIIQRAFRDVSTIKTHASSQFLDTVPALSRLHFGITLEPRAPSGG